MTRNECIWTEKECIIDHFSSDFYYERQCDKKHMDDAERYCPNCGNAVVTELIDLAATHTWLDSIFNKGIL
jgi:hypothetical protein